jgi:hypothetical protein
MNIQASDKQENSTPQKTANTRDTEFDEAVERIYRHYGSDLSAFYRDVQKELLYKREH